MCFIWENYKIVESFSKAVELNDVKIKFLHIRTYFCTVSVVCDAVQECRRGKNMFVKLVRDELTGYGKDAWV
jgi:hypothetical protein